MRQCLGNGYRRELPCSQQTQVPSEGAEGRLEDGGRVRRKDYISTHHKVTLPW